jgi:hypothetical protein
MPQPAFMVLSHHDNKRPGRSTHTVCTERLDALLHVWRSNTLTSIDGIRQFCDAALQLCIQSARNVRTDCTSRPPTCSTESHDHLSCIRQIPPVFRKWFAHHILDTNAGEALQSAFTFTTGICQQQPRLRSSIFPADPNMTSTQVSDWTCGIDDTPSPAWKRTP